MEEVADERAHLILGAPDSPEQRVFLGRQMFWCFVIGGAQFLALSVPPHYAHDPHAHEITALPLLILGVIIVVAGMVGRAARVPVSPVVWPFVMGFGCVMGFVFPLALGPSFAALSAFVPLFISAGAHTFFIARVAWRWAVAVNLCWAAGIVVVGGADIGGRIIAVGGVALTLAYVLDRVIDGLVARGAAERAARAEADRANAALSAASLRKTAFLARVSHELRTPLNAVLGFAGLVHDGLAGPLNQRQAEYIGEVVASGQHLLALVDDVLHVSRVEAGSDSMSARSFDLDPVVERSVALFRDQAARSNVRLATEIESLRLVGDERKLRQIVFNLVSNAVRFTPAGGEVHVSLRHDGCSAVLRVSDTGPGIDASQHEMIFEPFEQVAEQSGKGGTGLGLAVAKRFAELHGGTICVDSAPSVGASFEVRLPLDGDTSAATTELPARRVEDTLRTIRAQLVSVVGSAFGAGGAAIVTAVAVLAAPAAGARPVLAIAAVGAFLVLLVAARMASDEARRSPLAGHATVAVVAVGVVLAVAGSGSLTDAAGAGCTWIALAAVALVSRRHAWIYVTAAAAAYTAILATSTGHTTAFTRWDLPLASAYLMAATVVPLIERVRELAVSEADARLEAERATAATEAATRHKSEFVATMSHELRTPLNAINGFSEALREEIFGPITAEQAEYLDDILAADRHLLALINDVLDLAKLEAGRMPAPAGITALDAVVADAVGAVEGRGDPSPVVELAPALAPVAGDHVALTRAVTEFVSWIGERAAVHGGRVRIALLPSGDGLALTVSAPCTSRPDVTAAFEEFGSGGVAPRRGTGLGMALARRQILRHGGWCVAEATSGNVGVTAWLPGLAPMSEPTQSIQEVAK